MKNTVLRLLAFAAMAAVTTLPVQGALVISEVVFNEVGSDVLGEWIEIFNTGPAPILLTNYKIGDEETSGGTGTTEAMHRFPVGASIAPGEVQIVAVSATRFNTLYGFLPTYEATATHAGVPDMTIYGPTWDPDGGAFNMANTNDQAVILDPLDAIADAASWGTSTFAFNPALGAALDGQSYQRINAYVDTNTANDWETVGDANTPAAQRSTPGTVPVPEPSSLVIAIAMVGFGLARRRQ